MRTSSVSNRNHRARWAAIGAAVAVSLGAGGISIARATSPAGASTFVGTDPCRLLDTRPGEFHIGPDATLGADARISVIARGDVGECTGPTALPATATGLQLNVTPIGATDVTNLRVYPGAGDPPNASNLNPTPDQAPIPNAVTVDLDDDGVFSIYNRFGSVDVAVDVVGYYTDHHHDDRYYTKSMVDQLIADAAPDIDAYTKAESDARYYGRPVVDQLIAAIDAYTRGETDDLLAAKADAHPWSIHIAPSDFETNRWDDGNDDSYGADYWPAVNDGGIFNPAGLAFPDGYYLRAWYGLQLPAAYQAGTDVQVDMRWLPVSNFGSPVFPCESMWSASIPSVSRADAPAFSATTSWEFPGSGPFNTLLPATQAQYDNHVTAETYMIIDGTDLMPGDMVSVELVRDSRPITPDSCAGISITGLEIHEAM